VQVPLWQKLPSPDAGTIVPETDKPNSGRGNEHDAHNTIEMTAASPSRCATSSWSHPDIGRGARVPSAFGLRDCA